MPFLTYICKGNAGTNNGPHKTVIFVPASALGSNTPGAGGGNPAGGVNPATAGGGTSTLLPGTVGASCPRCTFAAQPGDGQGASAANGLDYMQQERAIINSAQAPAAPPANSPVALAIPGADSAIRIPLNSPGSSAVGNLLGAGTSQFRLDSAGFKQLI